MTPGRRGAEGEGAIERRLASLLRLGATTAALVVLGGGVVLLARHGHDPLALHVFRGEPSELRSPLGVLREAIRPSGRGLVQLGLLLLILTPVARVAFSIYAFVRQRDLLYAVVTALVLATLLYGLVGGLGA